MRTRTSEADPGAPRDVLHVICEQDVGLFKLFSIIIPHVQWARSEGRVPVAYFGKRTCYWTPNGYRDRDTVWEYYFEPLVPAYPVSSIPASVRERITTGPPDMRVLGYAIGESVFVSSHTSPKRPNKTGGRISPRLRREASAIIREYIRPREYIRVRAEAFQREHFAGRYVIGLHVRSTDALVDGGRYLRERRVDFPRYFRCVARLLRSHPDAVVFVASDAHACVERIRERFGDRVVSCDVARHEGGPPAGKGPTGRIMPAYLTRDRDQAARNGEDAVVEYLLLCKVDHLIHNGSLLHRAVLLTVPELPSSSAIALLARIQGAFVRSRKRLRVHRTRVARFMRRGIRLTLCLGANDSFAFIPHRFLRDGFFAALRPHELRLYVFLVLAADRNGVSFHRYDSICSVLELPLECYLRARNALIAKDLIAFDGTRFQVLSLPETPRLDTPAPLTSEQDRTTRDPATIRNLVQQSLASCPREIP